MFPQNAISLIPQKAPFVMVDELLFANETTARCSFTIPAGHVMVGDGIFTEGGLLENMAQTAAAHAGYLAGLQNQPVKPGFIGAVRNFEITAWPEAGSILETEVTIESHMPGVTAALGKVYCKGEQIARCELRIMIQQDSE